jgi:hypothetical protein
MNSSTKCISHTWNDGKKYIVIGMSEKPNPNYKLPYTVIQCVICKTNFTYDEAGNYFEFKGDVYISERIKK